MKREIKCLKKRGLNMDDIKTAAVICEFNPFHNGHKYIMDRARSLTGARYVVAFMSGNYVQRGEPAIINKFARARAALSSGADLVIELPPLFSCASAADFAMAGVAAVCCSAVADYLVFGAENSNLEELMKISEFLSREENESSYSESLRAALSKGMSFPKAREAALDKLGFKVSGLISGSNNILALEYLRALRQFEKGGLCGGLRGRLPEPVAVTRLGDAYSEADPVHSEYTSATAVRGMLLKGCAPDSLSPYVPTEALEVLRYQLAESRERLLCADHMSNILNFKLIELSDSGADLSEFAEVSPALSSRIMRTALSPMTFTDRITAVKTKDVTYSRVQRALLHIALGIKKSECELAKSRGYAEYLRILGFRRSAAPLLKKLKASSELPVISKAADHRELLRTALRLDNIYYSLLALEGAGIKNEFEREIVII